MRKLISSILAIIVLILSCIPCSDVDAMPASQGREVTMQAAPTNDCNNCHTTDVCSPFCTCSCCAGFALPIYQTIELKPIALYAQKVFAVYRPQQASEVFLPIWQPPQIG